MTIHNFLKNKILQPYIQRKLCTPAEFQTSIQVCVLGAHTPLGRSTSFLLKQNPIISVLRVQGDEIVHNLAVDLNYIDTKCKVQAYDGMANVSKAVRSADIILMLGNEQLKEDTPLVDRVMTEGRRVYEMTKECTSYAQRSIILVGVTPVSVIAPLVEGVFKETHWYHPGRIIGSAALAQIKANTLLGRYQDLDPQICKVPILGGPDIDLAVPLFSRATPIELNDRSAKKLMATFRGVKEDDFPKIVSKANFVENCTMSEAFALNSMITGIGLGICGDKKAYCNAFVRSNLINTCKHLVTTVQFSRGGVIHNYGVPQLTKLELRMFEKAALQIKEREQVAAEFLEYVESGKSKPPPFKQKEMDEKKLLKQRIVKA